ncbi:MAG: hypothetical protein ACRD0K_27905 [Egibacteraceae bacterium]
MAKLATYRSYKGPILIMGPRASGKSAVGRQLALRLSWSYVSFGSYVRQQAAACGVEGSLRLEAFGHQLISERGAGGPLADVLGAQKMHVGNVVLDGVRHSDMLECVERLYGTVVSVYLEVPEQVRYERWLRREALPNSGSSRELFLQLSQARIERRVFELSRTATHVIDGARPVAEVISEIMSVSAVEQLQ